MKQQRLQMVPNRRLAPRQSFVRGRPAEIFSAHPADRIVPGRSCMREPFDDDMPDRSHNIRREGNL